MKYIRTKDNRIYEVIEEYNTTYLVKAHKNYRNIKKAIDGTKIVYKASCTAQADTIEELCDCFIKIKREIGFRDFILKFGHKDLKLLKEQMKKYPNSPVYGAIHIEDKGLIYVAKMNDKGELELL